MRILILGGDGYLGWPTAMRFSSRGHEVFLVDNFSRRRWHHEHSTDSLTPISGLADRIDAWREVSGRELHAFVGNIEDGEFLDRVVAEVQPEAVVHYGEQPSAPYSMISRRHAVETQQTNVIGNLNLLWSLRDRVPDCHLVKLGTMGEYGIETEETALDERLCTRFDYDEIFGTALNRFCVQTVIGHPLTVYGKGGQTRGFLNIRDTLQCVELAVANPPDTGVYRVFNQFTESFSVSELADLVQRSAAEVGIAIEIDHIDNPRVEAEEHYYNPVHTKLLDLGLEPSYLGDELVRSMLKMIERHRDRVVDSAIDPKTRWNPSQQPA